MRELGPIAVVVWEGDLLDLMRLFPDTIRADFGGALRAMQHGEPPIRDARPMQSVGKRVFELKLQDERTWYRTLYLSRIDDKIHILHCFEKSSRKTPTSNLEVARKRLANVLERRRMEKKDEKQNRKT